VWSGLKPGIVSVSSGAWQAADVVLAGTREAEMGSDADDFGGKIKGKARAVFEKLKGHEESDADPDLEPEPAPEQEIKHDGMVVLTKGQAEAGGEDGGGEDGGGEDSRGEDGGGEDSRGEDGGGEDGGGEDGGGEDSRGEDSGGDDPSKGETGSADAKGDSDTPTG
jgi:hypothetical protein